MKRRIPVLAAATLVVAALIPGSGACSGSGGAPPAGDGGATQSDAGVGHDRDGGAPTLAAFRHDVLFVGNSYVYVNDVPGHYRSLVSALGGAVRVEQVAPGGYTLARHAADANAAGQPLSRWLRTGTRDETSFDAVILQEQSQIGGFPERVAQRRASVAGALELARLAVARGATVALYHTWGYKRGDPNNAELFGTYTKMQGRLDMGYLALDEHLRSSGIPVRVAPVGGGFRIVHEDVVRAGGDPLAPGSDFDALYEADGSHPSPRGAYLAACILAGTITGVDAAAFRDDPVLGQGVSARLRGACARALADPRWRPAALQLSDSTLKPADGRNRTSLGEAIVLRRDGRQVLASADSGNVRAFERVSADEWLSDTIAVPTFAEGFTFAQSADAAFIIAGNANEHGNTPGGYAGAVRVYGGGAATPALLPRAVFQTGQRFGAAVAINGDGTRALVSATGEDQSKGAARIYVRRFDGWEEEARLDFGGPAAGRYFGVAVAISEDGTRALVGAPSNAVGVRGHVGVYALLAGGWREEALLASPLQDGDWFGGAVALSAAGDRALVGALQAGLAVVFVRDGTTWTAEETLRPARELYGTLSLGEPGRNGEFGTTVALSADGRRALVGAPIEDRPGGVSAGSAFLFERSGASWRQERVLLPRTPGYAARFGQALALSANGSVGIVAAPTERLFPDLQIPLATGAVHVFELRSSPNAEPLHHPTSRQP